MSNPPLNTLFDQVLDLAKDRDGEHQKLFLERGSFYVAFAGKVTDSEKRDSINAPLLKCLDGVHEDGLRKILAVMYYGKSDGKNGDGNYPKIFSQLRDWDKTACISKLHENPSLFLCLRDGKARVERDGLSLEKL